MEFDIFSTVEKISQVLVFFLRFFISFTHVVAYSFAFVFVLIYSFIWVFFHKRPRITGQQVKGETLTPLYHFHSLHRHLDNEILSFLLV